MKKLYLLALIPLLFYIMPANAEPTMSIDIKELSIKYGDSLEYTITISKDKKDHAGEYALVRFINKAKGTATDWSEITLEGSTTTLTKEIIGQPFDNKGQYLLDVKYQSPLWSWRGMTGFDITNEPDHTVEGKAHYLSPIQQTLAGIFPQEVVCKQGLHLEERIRNGPTVCIKPESRDELLKRGFIHDQASEPEGLVFEGLHNTYKESEPVGFVLWYKGMADQCSFATIQIFNDTEKIVWSLDEPSYKCPLGKAPEYLEKSFGPDLAERPVLSTGKYKIVANFENQKLEKEIIVK